MGRKLEGLKASFKNLHNREVEGNTLGEVYENLNLQFVSVALTLAVVDATGAVDTPTVVLKKGSTIGSGDTVSAETDGTYTVVYGDYNVSVSKTGYTTKTAVISIGYDDARAEAKAVTITIVAAG
ncbi:MAG: hypothetical protein RBT65_17445 [Methanolobus sp.]|nr:hypothetical protein [Methanolobus sp.]